MNLLQQLESAARPRAELPMSQRLSNWAATQQKGWQEHTAKAIAKYRAAMQDKGWVAQSQIEWSLGYASTSSTIFLKRLREEFQLIERRNKGGAKTYSRKLGYEYRWKHGA